jgi:hypothetical protein
MASVGPGSPFSRFDWRWAETSPWQDPQLPSSAACGVFSNFVNAASWHVLQSLTSAAACAGGVSVAPRAVAVAATQARINRPGAQRPSLLIVAPLSLETGAHDGRPAWTVE